MRVLGIRITVLTLSESLPNNVFNEFLGNMPVRKYLYGIYTIFLKYIMHTKDNAS